MKDIYYLIGFLSIAFYIYNILYYDYLTELDKRFLSKDTTVELEYDDIILFFTFIFERIIPSIIVIFWLSIGLLSFNGLFILIILVISKIYNIFAGINKEKKRSRIEVIWFSLLFISLILFSIYNTYYLKFDLLKTILSLI